MIRRSQFLGPDPVINMVLTIALLSLLVMVLPGRGGEAEMQRSVTKAEFVPSRLATATTTTASSSPEPPVGLLSPTEMVTGTRFVEPVQIGTSTQIATDVHRTETTAVPLLTALARGKPSIWGSKVFYALLGLTYVTLLCLLVRQFVSISGDSGESR